MSSPDSLPLAYYYRVYGLTLRTNQPLIGLLPISEPVDAWDVSIHLSKTWQESSMPVPISAWQLSPKHPGVRIATLEEGTYLLLSYIGDELNYVEFAINPNGEQIWIAVSEELNLRCATSLLCGIVLGCVLRIRGVTCLHATVVIVEEQAIAMLGAKGAGKSTTTAALLQRGARLIADDVAVLVEQKNKFLVQPGYPALRLHEDVAIKLYGSYEHLQIITPKPDIWPFKRELSLLKEPKLFPQEPVPLAAIYILEERHAEQTTVEIEVTPPVTGLLNLMQNTYVSWMLDQTDRENEFRVLSRLAATVPLKKVYRPDDLAMLPQISEAIMENAKTTI